MDAFAPSYSWNAIGYVTILDYTSFTTMDTYQMILKDDINSWNNLTFHKKRRQSSEKIENEEINISRIWQ
jgi:hypothetical protein